MNRMQEIKENNHAVNLFPVIREAIIIFITASLVAVSCNVLRQAGLPLFSFSPAKIINIQQMTIPDIALSEAYDLYQKNKVVFVDARDPFSFEEGHIAGAVNIYPDETALRAANLKKMLSPGSVIITYCDGPQCPLSKETAQGLKLQGLPVVKVLVNGWSLWLNAGYPVAKGKT
ncbi:MAG: rhodanese-like domain-containing protein [Smithellaceae bacterium]